MTYPYITTQRIYSHQKETIERRQTPSHTENKLSPKSGLRHWVYFHSYTCCQWHSVHKIKMLQSVSVDRLNQHLSWHNCTKFSIARSTNTNNQPQDHIDLITLTSSQYNQQNMNWLRFPNLFYLLFRNEENKEEGEKITFHL